MGVFAGPEIVEDGLVLALDAGNTKSYPGPSPIAGWYDLSGNGNNGTFAAASAPTYDSANGGSLTFDGTDDYVSLSSSIIGTDEPFTYEIAVYRTGNGTDWPRFFINGGVNSSITITQYNDTTGVLFRLTTNKGTYDEYNLPSGTLVNNQWVCLSFTFNTSSREMNAYINGVKYGNGTSANDSAAPSTSTSSIGGDSSSSWEGRIAYARMYNRTLTQAEIQQNFNATRKRFGI